MKTVEELGSYIVEGIQFGFYRVIFGVHCQNCGTCNGPGMHHHSSCRLIPGWYSPDIGQVICTACFKKKIAVVTKSGLSWGWAPIDSDAEEVAGV